MFPVSFFGSPNGGTNSGQVSQFLVLLIANDGTLVFLSVMVSSGYYQMCWPRLFACVLFNSFQFLFFSTFRLGNGPFFHCRETPHSVDRNSNHQ